LVPILPQIIRFHTLSEALHIEIYKSYETVVEMISDHFPLVSHEFVIGYDNHNKGTKAGEYGNCEWQCLDLWMGIPLEQVSMEHRVDTFILQGLREQLEL
jgi:hypothetical protein